MRQLHTCDFCGGDADGVYEPLPADVGAQRRVALCADCRDTLETLLAPLSADEPERATIDNRPASDESGSPGSASEGGEATSEREEAADDVETGGDETESDETESDETESDETEETESADTGAGDTEPERSSTTARAEEPTGFRKVMRLLNNRSLPIERRVAVELATGAYEFSESEVEAALDHAVERGVLAESDGELRRA